MKTLSFRALQHSPTHQLEQLRTIYGVAMRGLRTAKPTHARAAAVNLLLVCCELERRGGK